MNYEWQCVKCEKIYPQNCEGAVHGGYFPFQPYITIKCQCGGELKICPTRRAPDAATLFGMRVEIANWLKPGQWFIRPSRRG